MIDKSSESFSIDNKESIFSKNVDLIYAIIASIYCLQYSTYLVHSLFWDRFIKIDALIILILLKRFHKLSPDRYNLLLLYMLLFLEVLFAGLDQYDLNGILLGIIQLFKHVIQFSILPLMLFQFLPQKRPPSILVKVILFWAVLLSIQSIILFGLVYINIPVQSKFIQLEKYSDMPERSYGILGYGNALQCPQKDRWYVRTQSWFIEPSCLAGFLLFPLIVMYGFYLSTKKKIYLLFFFLIFCALLTTSSLAAFLGLFASIFFLFISNLSRKNNRLKNIAPLIAGLLFILFAQLLIKNLNNIYLRTEGGNTNRLIKMLARDPHGGSGSLLRTGTNFKEIWENTTVNILGNGLEHTSRVSDFSSSNALIYWLSAGGIPAAFLFILILYKLYSDYCHPLLISSDIIKKCIGTSFIALTVHELGYGIWLHPYYLYIVAIMIIYAYPGDNSSQIANYKYNGPIN
ncbi:MAG: hypothetical protein AB9903_29330 [Vulcanimicrobiota bacterium]